MATRIDKKDRAILQELSKDCRQNKNAIARKLQLSRDIVNYRINKLCKARIIERFMCEVDLRALGFQQHYLFLSLKKADPERKDAIVQSLVENPFTMVVMSSAGRFDLVVELVSRDLDHFKEVFRDVCSACGQNLAECEILMTEAEYKLDHNYLLPYTEEGRFPESATSGKVDLTEEDWLILRSLADDAAKPIQAIAEETGIQRDTVAYHIKRLVQQRVIRGFRASIDPKPGGYEWHIVMLKLDDTAPESEAQLKGFLLASKEIIFAVKTVGRWEYHLEVIVKDQEEFGRFLRRLTKAAHRFLARPEALIVLREHKYTNLPKGMAGPPAR